MMEKAQAIANLISAVVTRGVGRGRQAVEAAMLRGVGVDECWGIVGYWDSCHGVLQAGALHERLVHAEPGQRPDAGWPEHERPGAKAKRKADPTNEAIAIVKALRREKKSDEQIGAALAARGLEWEGFTNGKGA